MGSSASKPETVFHGQTPVRFSSDLLTTLENSSESDSTREKALELHIQNRVAAELRRLEERESEILASLEQQQQQDVVGGVVGEEAGEQTLDRNKVNRELEALRERLQELPRVRELEKEMSAARKSVVQCLRKNETRPLDCWKEVEEFKEQTRRLEKAFVVRTVGREY
ncbi:DUF1690-domain-containing protein [Ascodesmis nigricans]|uniref:DUF1690-domain-containing protein n=1 Tax=Ascodesmis nigricans TaxID=341454 RepID=A0A4S2N3J4_9PEZI|nr:DUF1690-domain-containing protein [Ascodesmis nigricans]